MVRVRAARGRSGIDVVRGRDSLAGAVELARFGWTQPGPVLPGRVRRGWGVGPRRYRGVVAAQPGYEERFPQGPLGRWSPCVWVRRAPDADAGAGLVHDAGAIAASERALAGDARGAGRSGMFDARVVPDGCTDLLWRRGALEVAGPDTCHRVVPLDPGELIVGVRLRPGAARPLLGAVPATAVTDAQPGLGELWGGAALRLSERLAGVREPWRIAAVLAGALGERMEVHGPDRVAVAVAAALDRPRPPGIAGLAWELGFSERQLRRRVRAAVGYGPKTLEQILRFRRVVAAAAGVSGPDWGRIAAEQGFADQAHLSRQVRRWSGATPRAFAAGAAPGAGQRV